MKPLYDCFRAWLEHLLTIWTYEGLYICILIIFTYYCRKVQNTEHLTLTGRLNGGGNFHIYCTSITSHSGLSPFDEPVLLLLLPCENLIIWSFSGCNQMGD